MGTAGDLLRKRHCFVVLRVVKGISISKNNFQSADLMSKRKTQDKIGDQEALLRLSLGQV
jgi:hypothetical protein